jgi:hypothetical protein
MIVIPPPPGGRSPPSDLAAIMTRQPPAPARPPDGTALDGLPHAQLWSSDGAAPLSFAVVDLETTGASAIYDRILEIAVVRLVGRCVFCQGFQRPAVSAGQTCPLAIHPVGEGGGIGEEESVQEGAAIQRDRAFIVRARQCSLEFGDIQLDQGGVQPQLVAGSDQGIVVERGAEHVARDLQQVTAAFRVALRPQPREQFVAAHSMPRRDRQQRQQCEPMSLRGSARELGTIAFESRSAEQADANHLLRFEGGVHRDDTERSPVIPNLHSRCHEAAFFDRGAAIGVTRLSWRPSMSSLLNPRVASLMLAALLSSGCSQDPVTAPSPAQLAVFEAAPVVLDWQQQARTLVGANRLSPLAGARVYAALSVAQHRAVRTVDQENGGGVAGGRSLYEARRGAVAGASARVLSFLFPGAAGALEDRVAAQGNAGAGEVHPQFTRGVTQGRTAGDSLVSHLQRDGFTAPWNGTVPTGPGLFTPVAMPPAGGMLRYVTPYFLTRVPSSVRVRRPHTCPGRSTRT